MLTSARPASSGWSLADAVVALLLLTAALLLVVRLTAAGVAALESVDRQTTDRAEQREAALEELRDARSR